MIQVMYFAWVRERIGIPSEKVNTAAITVRQLVDELIEKENRYKLAFSDLTSLRVAIDQELGDFDSSIVGATEIAFFPPMTGG